MRLAGLWIGWGLGDWSHNPDGTDRDPTVRRAKAYMRAMFRKYAGHLADSNIFDQEMATAVFEMQSRYVADARLFEGQFHWGVLDLETQYVMGFKKRPAKPLPIIFTVEGHMSNPFVGPCAFVAQTLEAQGLCHWKPIAYNNTAMPFDNESGIRELVRNISADRIEGPTVDGQVIWWPFPAGTPWGIIDFSQGGIVGGRFRIRYLFNGGQLSWRTGDLKRSLSFGNPYREFNQIASWVPDPPKPDTQGISDERLNATGLILPNGQPLSTIHREHSRHGDIYAENEVNEAGQKKTAVYKAVQGQFTGRGSLLTESIEIISAPQAQIFPVVQAIWSGGMFVFNMGPHGMYDLNPCVEWMRGVAA